MEPIYRSTYEEAKNLAEELAVFNINCKISASDGAYLVRGYHGSTKNDVHKNQEPEKDQQ